MTSERSKFLMILVTLLVTAGLFAISMPPRNLYLEPLLDSLGQGNQSLVAALVLSNLLLVALFGWLLRRHLHPLKAARVALDSAPEGDWSAPAEATATGEIGRYLQVFDLVLGRARERVRALEAELSDGRTWNKILTYQKVRIEAVLRSLPSGLMVMDEAGSVIYANDKLGAMLGVDPEDIVGRELDEWCQESKLLGFLACRDGGRGHSFPGGMIDLVHPHNPANHLSVVAYPLFPPRDSSEILGTLVVFSDVTEERMAKKTRKELIAQLSHELKTPLHVIGMYGEMLLEDDDEGSRDRLRVESANVIKDEVERITSLINNMLSLSRMEMGNVALDRKRTRLNDLLRDAFETATRNGKDLDLRFRLELPNDVSLINVDKELLRVAINNLLTNAIKYNRPGGVVLGAREDDDRFEIYVRDTGIGIASDDRSRIFDKFFRAESTVESSVEGHGLGLSLTREIIQAHFGEIDVTSVPGEGSEFVIRLKKTPILIKEAVSP